MTESLLDTAALDTESAYEFEDDGFDADYAWLDDEPDISEQFEIDSALTSAGWGTDEDYGYYGDDEPPF